MAALCQRLEKTPAIYAIITYPLLATALLIRRASVSFLISLVGRPGVPLGPISLRRLACRVPCSPSRLHQSRAADSSQHSGCHTAVHRPLVLFAPVSWTNRCKQITHYPLDRMMWLLVVSRTCTLELRQACGVVLAVVVKACRVFMWSIVTILQWLGV